MEAQTNQKDYNMNIDKLVGEPVRIIMTNIDASLNIGLTGKLESKGIGYVIYLDNSGYINFEVSSVRAVNDNTIFLK